MYHVHEGVQPFRPDGQHYLMEAKNCDETETKLYLLFAQSKIILAMRASRLAVISILNAFNSNSNLV